MKRLISLLLFGILTAALSATAQTAEWKIVPTLSEGAGLSSVTSPAESLFVAVGGYGRVVRSTDGGSTWGEMLSGLPAVWESNLVDISFGTSLTGTAVGASGAVVQTTNGGADWTQGSVGVAGYLSSVFFLDENFGVVTSPFFLKTRDGGKHWDQRIFSFEGAVQDIVLLDTSLAFAVGPSGFSGAGTIFRSDNGGESWDFIGTEGLGIEQLYQITFADREHGLIVGSGGTVIRTENGGVTWTLAASGVTADLFGVAMENAMHAIAVGAEGTIIRTTDGGQTWREEDSPTDSTLTGVGIDGSGIAVAVGGVESGIILRSNPISSGVKEGEEAEEFSLHVAPNPSSGEMQVLWRPGSGTGKNGRITEVEMVIRNLLGKDIARFAVQANEGSLLWNASDFPAGVYFVTLTAGEKKTTKRVVVSR